jgi:hypothetical protein
MLHGVTVVSANDVWAVGTYYNGVSALLTLAEHWDGKAWRVVPGENPGSEGPFAANVFHDVAAISPTDVRAVGYFHGQGFDPNHALFESWCP